LTGVIFQAINAHLAKTHTLAQSTERLALYQQGLAVGADIDVLQVDVVWPGILHRHLIDLTPYLGDAPAAPVRQRASFCSIR
jgi:hypothetical protein